MEEFGKLDPNSLPESIMDSEILKGGTWRESAKTAKNKGTRFSKEEV